MLNNDFMMLKNCIEKAVFSNQDLITANNGDGRLTSAISENTVITFFQDFFEKNNTPAKIVPAPTTRCWYDCLIQLNNGEKIPVNIKITTGNQADNISSKQGMFFALTGIWPESVRGLNHWDTFNQKLLENYNPHNNKDYYFIIYFKEEEKFFFSSLKRINVLTPNGSNLPFQCKWKNNLTYTQRLDQEQGLYILNTFIDSFIKKANGLDILLQWREEQKNE